MRPPTPMPSTLNTERLSLRPFEPADTSWHRLLVAERINPARRHAPEADPAVILSVLDGVERTGLPLYAVTIRATCETIGYCGLIVGRTSAEEPEIAYELLKASHRHGYATEAAGAVVDAAAARFERLWATVASWNDASLRVLDKLGAIRDHSTDSDGEELVWCRLDLALPDTLVAPNCPTDLVAMEVDGEGDAVRWRCPECGLLQL